MSDLPFGLDERPWRKLDPDDDEQSELYDFEDDERYEADKDLK